MKIVVLVGDGMGDFPVESLGGLTPLQAAKAPTLQKIASSSDLRMVNTVPKNLSPGSDVANMALLGYDAEHNYTGRAPIEAAGANFKMNPSDVAFSLSDSFTFNSEAFLIIVLPSAKQAATLSIGISSIILGII